MSLKWLGSELKLIGDFMVRDGKAFKKHYNVDGLNVDVVKGERDKFVITVNELPGVAGQVDTLKEVIPEAKRLIGTHLRELSRDIRFYRDAPKNEGAEGPRPIDKRRREPQRRGGPNS